MIILCGRANLYSSHAAARARGQAAGAARPPPYPCYGSGKSHPTVDSKGSPVLPASVGPVLDHVSEKTPSDLARVGVVKGKAGEERASLRDALASVSSHSRRTSAEHAFARADRILNHVQWEYLPLRPARWAFSGC
jgi:hypothetical protein